MSSETGTASVDIELDNLVLTMQHDDDHPRLLKWLGEGDPDNKAQIAFTLSSANLIPVDCEVSVYPLARTDTTVPVRTYTIQHGAPSPGPVSADWDGRDDQGQFVPPGLYAFDIDAVWAFGACPHCADWRASRYLSLYLPEGQGGAPEAEATYLGFVDGKHQFEVSYVLRDHSRNAGAGQIDLYGPTLEVVESKALTSPELAASGGGHLHQVTVEVDPALISLPGRYYFALSVDDDHSDAEKAHRTKPALQAGSTHCVPVEIAVVHPTDYIEYDPGSQDPDRSQPHLTFDLMHAPASVPITYEVKLYPVVGSSLVDPLKVYHYEITDVGDGAAALDLAAVDYNDFSVRAVEYAEWTLLRDVGVHDDFIGKLNILGLGGCHFLFSGEDVDGRAVLKNAALVWPGGANFTSDTESWDEFPGPNFGAYAASEQRKLKDGSEYASDNAMDSWALPAYHAMGLDAIVYIQGHGGVGAQHTTGRAADVNELNLDPAHRPLYDAYTIVNSP